MTPRFQRFFIASVWLALIILLLTGCATAPSPTVGAEPQTHAQHQTKLTQIQFWSIQGNLAFFNDASQQRDAARYTWQQRDVPNETIFRLHHPLRGTLARIEQDSSGSRLMNQRGEIFQAEHIDALLYQQSGMVIPFQLIAMAVTGRQPPLPLANRQWYEDGTLASYTADATVVSWDPQVWHIELSDYRPVIHEGRSFVLPHLIEASQSPIRVRLSISQWRELNSK